MNDKHDETRPTDLPAAQTAGLFKHAYHQSLVYKIFLASKPESVSMTFAEALEAIRWVSEFTANLKQIVYLVGWQFDGHDSKYPAWSEVNPRLKRPEDADAHASLLWLMREARQYNAVVSLHINMFDAYQNSPLWQEYVDKDLISKLEGGKHIEGGHWGGEQSYVVCAPREWETGMAQRRIDALLAFLPIGEAGTIHLDCFYPVASPGHRVTVEDSTRALGQFLDYWNGRGIDVTIEDIHYPFLGRTPMVWHLNADERTRLMFPPDVLCGGGAMWNNRCGDYTRGAHAQPFRPEQGCLYEEAWGVSVDNDLNGMGSLPAMADAFFLNTVPWLFLNLGRPLCLTETAEKYEVEFSHGVVTTVLHSNPRNPEEHYTFTMRHGDRVCVENTDLCMAAPWLGCDCIAYSKLGCQKEWKLPPEWLGVEAASAVTLYPDYGAEARQITVHEGHITLRIAAGQAIRLTPV